MIRINCDGTGGCFRPFWLEDSDNAWFEISGQDFTCPNCGKKYSYTKGPQAGSIKKVRVEYDRLKREVHGWKSKVQEKERVIQYTRAELAYQDRRIAALKGVITKLKRRNNLTAGFIVRKKRK